MDTSAGDVFEQLESAVAKWSAQLGETETRLHEAAAAPHTDGAVAESLQREVQELRETVESLLAALEAQRLHEAASLETDALGTRCAELEAELQAAHEAVNALREERDTAREALDELRDERDELRAELAAAQADSEAAVDVVAPSLAAFDSHGRRRRLGEILLEANLVSEKQLTEALREQKWTRRRRLGDILIERGLASEVLVGVVLAGQLRLPFVNLDDVSLDEADTRRIPAKMALRHNVIPLRVEAGRLVVATANPLDLIALDDVEMACGMPVQPVVAAASAIRARLSQYFELEE